MISVICPVKNDKQGLKDTLESLIGQKGFDDYEVLVVDGESDDGTWQLLKRYERNYGFVKAFRESEGTSYYARNLGIRESSGDKLVFVDADMWFEDYFLKKISEKDFEYASCDVSVVGKDNIWEKWDWECGFPIPVYMEYSDFIPTCCMFTTREVVEDVGGFDGRLQSGADNVFGKMMRAQGRDFDYFEDIKAYHPARDSAEQFWEKYTRIGKGHRNRTEEYPQWFYGPQGPAPFKGYINVENYSTPEKIGLYFVNRFVWFATRYSYYKEAFFGDKL